MTTKIYRAYPDDEIFNGKNHYMSIVASDSDFSYAAPSDSGFDDERRAMLLGVLEDNNREFPKDVDSWIGLAMYNISGFNYINATEEDNLTDEDFAYALDAEFALVKDAEEARNEDQSVEPITAAVDACPPATQDISINLANREKAIKDAAYGPLNPAEPNEEFWQEKSTRWSITPDEAKKSVCGNCVMFITTTKMKDCIAQGIEQGGSSEDNAWDAVDAAELGYCEAFDFKCAASRTCNAWVAGGPIDDSKAKE